MESLKSNARIQDAFKQRLKKQEIILQAMKRKRHTFSNKNVSEEGNYGGYQGTDLQETLVSEGNMRNEEERSEVIVENTGMGLLVSRNKNPEGADASQITMPIVSLDRRELSNAVEVPYGQQLELQMLEKQLNEMNEAFRIKDDQYLKAVEAGLGRTKELELVRSELEQQTLTIEIGEKTLLTIMAENEGLKNELSVSRNKVCENEMAYKSAMENANKAWDRLCASETANKIQLTQLQKELNALKGENEKIKKDADALHLELGGLQNLQAKLAEVAECTICTKFLEKPTIFACGHVICSSCAKKWKKECNEELANSNESLLKKKENKCPFCRKKVSEMSQDIYPLKSAFSLVKEFIQSRQESPPEVAADVIDVDAMDLGME